MKTTVFLSILITLTVCFASCKKEANDKTIVNPPGVVDDPKGEFPIKVNFTEYSLPDNVWWFVGGPVVKEVKILQNLEDVTKEVGGLFENYDEDFTNIDWESKSLILIRLLTKLENLEFAVEILQTSEVNYCIKVDVTNLIGSYWSQHRAISLIVDKMYDTGNIELIERIKEVECPQFPDLELGTYYPKYPFDNGATITFLEGEKCLIQFRNPPYNDEAIVDYKIEGFWIISRYHFNDPERFIRRTSNTSFVTDFVTAPYPGGFITYEKNINH